ncbi:potassium channel family protein [Trueperella sp. LYQ143]|uniref:potassium channel family protein n=1 Tax=unclassified Trueperella TaxID=2630174 RepID=UPI0039836557
MHFVIMGCGRVGSALATNLVDRGHSVSVIDQNPVAFNRLPDDFPGQQVTGLGFDRGALRQAGIEDAFAFAAVSNGDNSNIIAARVVRELYGVERVVARIYDSSRASIYQRMGISVVAPAAWTADQVMRNLIPIGPHVEHVDSATGAALFYVDVDPSWYGKNIATIERLAGARVAYLTRNVKLVVPHADSVLQDGDELRFIAPLAKATAIQRTMNHPCEKETL